MDLKKTTLCLLFLFCGMSLIKGQEKRGGHINTIKAKYDIEFNLPQFDMQFVIPANTTFKLPKMIDDDVALEINHVSYYSFDLKHLKKFGTRTIRFFESYQDENPGMIFEIKPNSEYFQRELTAEEKAVPPVVSKLGTSVVRILKDDDISYTEYSFFKDGYEYNFYLDDTVSPDMKNRYLKIAASIAPKNLFQKRKQYENRVKYNFYKLEQHPKLPSDKEYKFDYYEGKTTRENWAVNSFSETKIRIPAGIEYMIYANYIEETGADSLWIYVNQGDYINRGQCSEHYFMKDFNLMLSSVMNVSDIDSYVKQMSKNYKVVKSVMSVIGQTPLYVYYYGSKDQGTLDLCIKTGEYSFQSLRIYGYSVKTKERVLRILSTFKWKNLSLPPLDDIIKLEKGDDVNFSEIELPSPDLTDVSKWEMMDLGLKFRMPGQISEYSVTRMQKTSKMSPSGIFMKARPTDRFGLSINRDKSPVMLFVSLADKPADVKENLRDYVRAWEGYKTITNVESNVLSVGNIEWSIMIYKLGDYYFATATTFVEGCLVTLYVNNVKDKQEILENLAFIKTFEARKPLKR